MEHVSTTLANMRAELCKARDNEITMASECAGQYVTDRHDTEAFHAIDREVNRLARAWDKMIARLDKWQAEAEKIESQCENFYGD
jgi:hypothetical protein